MKSMQGRPPVVFHFQPKNFKVMETPEELKKWEKWMKDEVGLKSELSNLSGSCTECTCNGDSCDCDED